jgi:Na+/glutamate symporter
LHIFGGQIDSATAGAVSRLSIILVVSIGMAIMMTIGFIRVIYNIPLNVTLTVIYGVVLVLSLFVTSEFLAFSFDAAGAATGALSVPFILALSRGISSLQFVGCYTTRCNFRCNGNEPHIESWRNY